MDPGLRSEDIVNRVRDQINKAQIKLWLSPYYNSDHEIGNDEHQALQLLSEKVAKELNIDQECCLLVMKDLQSRALNRLKSNEVFKSTGIATLKIKVCGIESKMVSVDMVLTSTSKLLIQEIMKQVNLSNQKLKLIFQGRILKSKLTLESQGVKNGSQLMALVKADCKKLKEDEKTLSKLQATKKDLHSVLQHQNGYIQIESQSGEALSIPPLERRALTTAMTMHEKGRVALKKLDYALALELFLEADKEYSECTSELLKCVDNYALLHLDIAWCYLCVRNPAQIPDADRRLSICEKTFHSIYGCNMERLMTIKGSTGNEMALYMRLHLLQGVVYFHQNRRAEAKCMFERALSELNGLKVDDSKVSLLMELGFSSAEARLGLRATYGNIETAEELINKKRIARESFEGGNHAKQLLQRERETLGLCQDTRQYCEPKLVTQMVGMGYDRSQSIAALKQANNNLVNALNIIQNSAHLLPPTNSVTDELIAQIVSLGYDPEFARKALEQHPSLQRTLNSLSNIKDSSVAGSAASEGCSSPAAGAVVSEGSSNTDAASAVSRGCSSSAAESAMSKSASAITFLNNLHTNMKKEHDKQMKAYQRLSEDLVDVNLAEVHLDFNMDQEEQFLAEYMSLL